MSNTTITAVKAENLINLLTKQFDTRLTDFRKALNSVTDMSGLNTWVYTDLLPKGKKLDSFKFEDAKVYLYERKARQLKKSLHNELAEVDRVLNAPELGTVKITVEWKKSRIWGAKPTADAWSSAGLCTVNSGSIGGCGYDKGSTAVARCLNQLPEVLKPLYLMKDANPEKKNHDLLGYGSGYGILPSIEGGVGVSCYPRIFEAIGYNFETIASGKTFDVYQITKK